MSADPETEMWSRVDLNSRPLLRLFIGKLAANLAGYSELIKAAELQRALSPGIRPKVILSDLAKRCEGTNQLSILVVLGVYAARLIEYQLRAKSSSDSANR
jgi:hypothetical protein